MSQPGGAEDVLRTNLADGVLTITLNRPHARNALTPTLLGLLTERLRMVDRDPAVRVVVVTGAGDAFCSGGDLRELDSVDATDPLAASWAGTPVWEDMELRTVRLVARAEAVRLLRDMGKPTIAVVNGAAIGAGLGLALACDLRLASERAVLGAEFARIGLSGDFGVLYFLTGMLGAARTRELALMGTRLGAMEAKELGLLTEVLSPDRLQGRVREVAANLAKSAPIAIRLMKENLAAAERLSLGPYISMESRNMIRTVFTRDAREGVAAFKERRRPSFDGT